MQDNKKTLSIIWKEHPDKTLRQLLTFAGEGELKDKSVCSQEFRQLLSSIKISDLKRFAEECLQKPPQKGKKPFQDSGFALQDIVNELGRRLDYYVKNGLYRGKKWAIGYDGVWIGPDGHILVVETKTTDDFKINLETLITYRDKFIEKQNASKETPLKISILLVVGKSGTDDLEAQIRGSRYAWDIRIISVSSLIKLAEIKEDSDEEQTLSKIRRVLVPFEYTRLDDMIDIMFAATKDIESSYDLSDQVESDASLAGTKKPKMNVTPRKKLDEIKGKIIEALEEKYNISLVARTRAQYWSVDRQFRVILSLSKWYERHGYYWYAYHPRYDDFLSEAQESYVVYGRVDQNKAYLLPYKIMKEKIPDLVATYEDNGDVSHWHVFIRPNIKDGQETPIMGRQEEQPLDLQPYEILFK